MVRESHYHRKLNTQVNKKFNRLNKTNSRDPHQCPTFRLTNTV